MQSSSFFKGAPRTSMQVEECSGTQPTGVCHTLSSIRNNNCKNNSGTLYTILKQDLDPSESFSLPTFLLISSLIFIKTHDLYLMIDTWYFLVRRRIVFTWLRMAYLNDHSNTKNQTKPCAVICFGYFKKHSGIYTTRLWHSHKVVFFVDIKLNRVQVCHACLIRSVCVVFASTGADVSGSWTLGHHTANLHSTNNVGRPPVIRGTRSSAFELWLELESQPCTVHH